MTFNEKFKNLHRLALAMYNKTHPDKDSWGDPEELIMVAVDLSHGFIDLFGTEIKDFFTESKC